MSAAALTASPTRRLRVGSRGRALHVELRGTGAPVLLLHGFTGSLRPLDATAAGLRAAGHATIAVDLLGHGRSDAPRAPEAYTMERCTQDLAAVLDAAGVRDAAVLGYSMGGRIALGLACARPERVRAAVLVGASAGIADPVERAARRAADEALAAAIERDGVAAFVERWMAQPLFASQARLGPEALARARRERLANRAAGLAGSLRGVGTGAQPPLHEALARLATPFLFVAGAEDPKFCAIARELAGRAPRGRAVVVPGAGHAAHLESPATFLAEACAFLRALPDPEPTRPRRTP